MNFREINIHEAVQTIWSDADVKDFWYDWFCKDTSLVRKGRNLLKRLKSIANSNRFDGTKCYVFFKNNCPMNGRLYDSFSICDMKTGDVVYWVTPSIGFKIWEGQAEVFGKHPKTGEMETLVRGTWTEIKKFFAGDDSLIEATARAEMIRQAEAENEDFKRQLRMKIWEEESARLDEGREYRDQLSHLLGEKV